MYCSDSSVCPLSVSSRNTSSRLLPAAFISTVKLLEPVFASVWGLCLFGERPGALTVLGGAVIMNAGAYTHYSYAIHDALRSVFVPKVEIHISDIHAREAFREVSVTAPACDHQIVGHGLLGYLEAMDWICAKKP